MMGHQGGDVRLISDDQDLLGPMLGQKREHTDFEDWCASELPDVTHLLQGRRAGDFSHEKRPPGSLRPTMMEKIPGPP
jgi:hypothetical protein